MEKKVKVKSLSDLRNITSTAGDLHDSIEVADALGSTANAKSILGLLALDYSKPVSLKSENASAVKEVLNALQHRS